MPGPGAGCFALGGHHHRGHEPGPHPQARGRVLLLPGRAHHGRSLRLQAAAGLECRSGDLQREQPGPAPAGQCRGLHRGPARHPELRGLSHPARLPGIRLVPYRPRPATAPAGGDRCGPEGGMSNALDPEEGAIMLVDKPQDWTSFNVVAKIRAGLQAVCGRRIKVGHGGTLDPLATGLLVIGTGKCTKQLQHFADADKTYVATLRLGESTPSYDAETEVDTERPWA